MSYNKWLSVLSTQHIVISSCAVKWFSLLNSYSKDGHAATSLTFLLSFLWVETQTLVTCLPLTVEC